MENKVNIAELLKDCPKGMELDCVMYDNLYFKCIREHPIYPIVCYTINSKGEEDEISFNWYGKYALIDTSKCVIFPKGKTTWEGFVPPCEFKDGDIVYVKSNKQNEYIIIFKEIRNEHIHKYVCFAYQHLSIDKCALCHLFDAEIIRLATEEEKQKLFDAIKDNGYKWNAETKTLEKLVEPRFKVGDRVKAIYNGCQYDIKELTDTHYTLVEVEYKFKYTEPIIEDKHWELVPNKFDLTTLKPFESRVLVRDSSVGVWLPEFFAYLCDSHDCPYMIIGGTRWKCCIPFEGNEHLMGKADDCDDFYKNW